MSSAPSCGFVGPSAGLIARQAMRRASGAGAAPALLVRWGVESGPTTFALTGPRRSMKAAASQVRAALPSLARVTSEGRLIVADLPADADVGPAVEALVCAHDGPVAVAAEVGRCDAVDAVLRLLDEVVLVEPKVPALRVLAEEELAEVATRLTVVPRPRSTFAAMLGGQSGQTMVVAVAVIATLMAVAVGLGLVASALGRSSDVQGRADVAALAGARALLEAQPLLYSPDPAQKISGAEYRARGFAAAQRTARANGLALRDVRFLGDRELPTRIQIRATAAGPRAKRDRRRAIRAVAEVTVAPLAASGGGAGDYTGPLAVRQGQRMRPDVALAFDRMAAAASGAGHALTIVSAFRSDAEQAALFAAHPDPKWVAPPGKSLHRLGTELDLGPSSAYAWLDANCTRFGFKRRYSWEAWHFGFVGNAGSTSLGYREGGGDRKATGSAIPSFVPSTYAPMISRAAQRWSVGAALLGAQLYAESNFNPRAQSAYAAGIAQFTPSTGLQYGLTPAERFDPVKAIDAQGHLMHDLLRQFGSVPLALAAYNAGPGAVAKCMCVPPFAETQAYVQKILALLGGAGIAAPAGLQIRLVA